MTENLNNGIKEVKKLTLKPLEKQAMLERVSLYIDNNPLQNPVSRPIKSPFSTWLPAFNFKSRLAHVSIAVALVVILGSGTALAAENALPGDLLYPVKIKVSEPIAGSLKIGAEAKTKWEGEKAVRRLEEADKLIKKGRFDDAKRIKIEKEFEKSADAFTTRLDKDKEKNEKKSSDKKMEQSFKTEVKDKLERIKARKNESSEIQDDEIKRLETRVNEKLEERKDESSEGQDDKIQNIEAKAAEEINSKLNIDTI